MAIDIKFFDLEDVEISLDKVTGGHDFGIIRKNQPNIAPVIVKNLGTNDANNLSITGSTLNSLIDVAAEEYSSETLASNWKTFSMLPDEGFVETLSLPNIPAGQTLIGLNKTVDDFTNPQTSNWIPLARVGTLWKWTGSSLTCQGETGLASFYGKANSNGWGNQENFDVTYNMNFTANAISGSAFLMFGFRMNCLGDEKGYLVNIKRIYNPTTNINTAFFEIRKGAGIKLSGAFDFGTILFTSQTFNWIDFMPLRFKVFTNANGLPEIKIWVNNVSDTDTPLGWGTTTVVYSYIDTLNTYPFSGGASLIPGSGITTGIYEIKKSTSYSKDINGKVYIRTIMGDGAEDQKVYNSAMELFYDPIEV